MTEYVTGQIYGWNGGECPVHPNTRIKFWTDEGRFECDAGHCRWSKDTTGMDPDIVCFQVITPYAELKVIYVNEHEDGELYAYPSVEIAKRCAYDGHIRIAVKYVEVKE